MSQTLHFGLVVLLTAVVGLVAVLSNRLTERVKIPVPLLVLAGAAISAEIFSALSLPSERTVERVVTVALVVILFDGGMHIGWRRFSAAAGAIASVGVLGTFLTAFGAAALLHVGFGVEWYIALLVATAIAPTDPVVVFSVLGRREIAGRSGTILEGESGANDPVGIALMTSLIAAGGLSVAAAGKVGGQFVLQMGVGAAVGVVGGRSLLSFMRRVPLPSEGLYPLRTLASAYIIYGLATLAHGSGFLAVFAAGIAVGDGRAPYKREIERFHAALASLAEIVAFVVLGLTVDLGALTHPDVWVPGVVLGAALAFGVRPLLVGACLLPVQLRGNERVFVLAAGLKGAVPILLGELLRAAHVPHAERWYGIVVVVVIFSVLVQGSLVPFLVDRLRLPVHTIEPEPWALGVRLRDEPDGVHQLTVQPGSMADGSTVEGIADQVGDAWVSIAVRDGELVPVRPDTELRAGDYVIVLAEPGVTDRLAALFGSP